MGLQPPEPRSDGCAAKSDRKSTESGPIFRVSENPAWSGDMGTAVVSPLASESGACRRKGPGTVVWPRKRPGLVDR
jgi:hypothetical protein